MRDDESIAMATAALTELEPVEEVAQKIAAGQAFTDLDAVRVANAYLRLRETGE